MAGRGDTVSLTYRADIKDLTSKLASIPGVTAAEARRAVAEVNKSLQAQSRALAGHAKDAGKNVAELRGQVSLAQESTSALGGAISRISPEIGGAVQSIGSMVGGIKSFVSAGQLAGASLVGIGAAAAVATVAIGGAAAWMHSLAAETAREAETARIAEAAHDSLAASLRAQEAATIDLREATGEWSKEQAASARTAATARQAVIDFGNAQEETKEKIRESIAQAQTWQGVLEDVAILSVFGYKPVKALGEAVFGFNEEIAAGEGRLAALAAAEKGATEGRKAARAATDLARQAEEAKRASTERAAAATRSATEADRAREAAARELAATTAQIAAIQVQYADKQLTDAERVRVSAGREISQVWELAAAYPHLADVQQAAAAATVAIRQDMATQLEALQVAEFDRLNAQTDAEVAAAQRVKEERIAAAREAAEEMAAIDAARVGTVVDIAGRTEMAFSAIAAQMSEANRDAARGMVAVAKGAAIVQIAIDTAKAVSSVNAAWAAVPPVNAALSALAIGVGAAQSAVVAGTQTTFHTGGPLDRLAPDETSVPIRGLRGEWMSTPQGRSVLGDDTLRKADAGIAPQPAVYAVSIYRHTRQIQRWKKDGLSAGDPIVQRIDAGRILGHRTDRG